MKTFKLSLTALCCMLISVASWAAQLPSYYPSDFDNEGTIQSINLSTGAISVRDKMLLLSTSVKVRSLATHNATKSNLNRGMNIGFSLDEDGDRQTISEVWILPANYFDD